MEFLFEENGTFIFLGLFPITGKRYARSLCLFLRYFQCRRQGNWVDWLLTELCMLRFVTHIDKHKILFGKWEKIMKEQSSPDILFLFFCHRRHFHTKLCFFVATKLGLTVFPLWSSVSQPYLHTAWLLNNFVGPLAKIY